MAGWRRTHTCGELRADHVGRTVTLNGWVNVWRDLGGVVFIDLRDRYGLTQVVFHPELGPELHEAARSLRNEYVVSITGTVANRLEGKTNPKLATGAIEVNVTSFTVLNKCDNLPFNVNTANEAELANEEIRLKHRYLDLRRPRMQEILILRHKLCEAMREHLSGEGFIEVETPILGRSTPEGARDYLVPSRVQPKNWYALPQSPQLYKQILMVAGMDKYFQIARCFRDEDLRANRQPEFTQLDIEMSFVDRDDVMDAIERLCCHLLKSLTGNEPARPFARLSYDDAMERYGNDKPDLRFGLPIVDVTDIAGKTDFGPFKSASDTTVSAKGAVRCLNATKAAEKYSRKQLDELTAYVGELGAKGLAWLKVEADKLNGPVAKFFAGDLAAELRERTKAEVGDLLLIVASPDRDSTHAPLAALRNKLGRDLKLYDPNAIHISWCVDFPMFEFDEETQRYVAMHHPFTQIHDDHWPILESDPKAVRAKAYDLIINGEEAAGGTIRLHTPEQQERIFRMMGLDLDEAKRRFGFLLDALKYGAPPHGGIAFGLDRWVMILAKLDNIRDCIAFPKTQRAADQMTGAPAGVDAKQLRDLGL